MEEIGEELIDLDEDNNPSKKEEIKKRNNNKSSIYIFLFSIIIIIFSIIILYSYLNKKVNLQKLTKSLIIFDFDKTITETDTFEEQINLLDSPEEREDLFRRIYEESWGFVMAEAYIRFHELNFTISDINKYIDRVQITSGMKELFHFLYNQKDKYILAIFSAGNLYQVNRVLQTNNLSSFFDEIIAFNSYEKDGKIIVEKRKGNFTCDMCSYIGFCKNHEFNLLKSKYEQKNIFFDKVYFICDGINDYCLARNLAKSDELFVRKKFDLDNYLYKEGYIKNIKCNINKWNNGFDIINFFKKGNN